jgi:hypothetical protein
MTAPNTGQTAAAAAADAKEAVRDHLPPPGASMVPPASGGGPAATPNVVITEAHLDAIRVALAVVQRPAVSTTLQGYSQTVSALTDLLNRGAAALRLKA